MSALVSLGQFVGTLTRQGAELGIAVETVGPDYIFRTNCAGSLTNDAESLLFFWIQRTFGGI